MRFSSLLGQRVLLGSGGPMMASLVFSYQAFSVRAWPALGPLRVIKTRTQPGNHDPFGRVPRVRHVVQGSPCPPAWSHTQSCQPGWWVGRGRDKKRKKCLLFKPLCFAAIDGGHLSAIANGSPRCRSPCSSWLSWPWWGPLPSAQRPFLLFG